MKTAILVLSAFLSTTAFASSSSISRAANSQAVIELEKSLENSGYELRSIEDNEAGAEYRSRCGCWVYTVTFQKVEVSGNSVQKNKKAYRLEISGMTGNEDLSEIERR